MDEVLHPSELVNQWKQESLTIEAAVGQILQNLAKIQIAFDAGSISRYQLRADVDDLRNQINLLWEGIGSD